MTTPDADDKKRPEFVERTFFLPRRLAEQVENLAEESSREVSEVVIEGLRDLFRSAPVIEVTTSQSPGTGYAAATPEADVVGYAGLDALADEPIESERLRQTFVRLLGGVEAKDHAANQHHNVVADLARKTAEALDLSEEQVRAVDLAGLVHDIGKSRIPDQILGNKGALSEEEWELVRRYPDFGAEIIGVIPSLAPVAEIVRHHQERWDDSGYPDRLAGDKIPIGAQVVAICDVFHVLTSERAYRPALPPEDARNVIEQGRDRHWNPELCELFLEKVVTE